METKKEQHVALSVVIPVYNSEAIFPELYQRLCTVLQGATTSFEVIAVVDGCRDRSFDVIQSIGQTDPRVKAIEFSRNFGHQAAITAGLSLAAGEKIAVMDDDLEDPPEILPQFLKKMDEGYDVVYGIRRKRERSAIYRILYKSFYRILGMLVDIRMPSDAGDFCIMTRRIVQVLNKMPENNRYLRGLRSWAGFEQTGVEYDRGARFASISGYSLTKYIKLALDAIFSFSYKPLTYVSQAGILIAGGSFLYGLRLMFIGRSPVAPGWASLFIAILFFSGVQLISIGIIGQYLARIYDEIKQRPKFVVKRSSNFTEDTQHD
jgi:polyisoprenyl-phosphate glycosyltransferase